MSDLDNAAAETGAGSAGLAGFRLALGLGQGFALYFLYQFARDGVWPATDGLIFAPVLAIAIFAPLLILQASATMRPATLVLWGIAATAFIGALAYYDVWSGLTAVWSGPPKDWNGGAAVQLPVWKVPPVPSAGFWGFTALALFVIQPLIAGGDADRRFIARYPTHFDVAWKQAVQLALSLAFALAFWILLWLGVSLFRMINIPQPGDFITDIRFYVPATTLVFAAAVHLTDVRPSLVRGVRTLALTLLGWLLPVLTLIVGAFLAALLFTGLEPLWATRSATVLLLTASIGLMGLINAAYQDGAAERAAPRVLQWSGTLAALLLVPLAALAAYALWLRIGQYGLTNSRVIAGAAVVVVSLYAAGYAGAALTPGAWLKQIERLNFWGAVTVVGVLTALLTPLADPARLSVADQVARLERGLIPAKKFDFNNLRWNGGRYGNEALERLSTTTAGPDAAFIREAATGILTKTLETAAPSQPLPFAERVIMRTPNGAWPESFAKQDWTRIEAAPACLRPTNLTCNGYLVDLENDGTKEILLVFGWQVHAVKLGADGTWRIAGHWETTCSSLGAAINRGEFKPVSPQAQTLPSLEVRGVRLAPTDTDPANCPS